MIKLSINKSTYKLITTWQEMTINHAIKICEVGLPASITSKNEGDKTGVTDFMDLEGLNFVKKIVSILGAIPEKELDKTHAGDVLNMFGFVMPLVFDLYSMTPQSYNPVMIEDFIFKGERYLMPQSKVFNDVFMPGVNVDSVTFVESANLMASIHKLKEHGIRNMPALIACYCKKEGEQFDQFVIMQRAEEFKELPMAVAWEVFFYMASSLHTAMKDMLTYLREVTTPAKKTTIKNWVEERFRRGYMRRLRRDMARGKMLN